MDMHKVYTAIGLMSGTSLDGVDVACIRTDGRDVIEVLDFAAFPYGATEREVIRGSLGKRGCVEAAQVVTAAHIRALESLGWEADVIGFHGQTIFHDPAAGETVQIGDGAALARAIGIDVVCDFRSADVAACGQGAPLLPLYHQARVRAAGLAFPTAILNIGGVGNVTWLGSPSVSGGILAFDTGPGNALIDDFVKVRTGASFDIDGALARAGEVDARILAALLSSSYFREKPPKSLDRDMWNVALVSALSDADGAATLSAFTVEAIKIAAMFFPAGPKQWFVCGGGRHNGFMMESLRAALGVSVQSVDALGWNGDALEAEGFAYLAVRSLQGLPLSVPNTTGVPVAQTGGVLHKVG